MDNLDNELVVNEASEDIDNLFLNDDITLIELFPNIYEIIGKNIIVKIYKNYLSFQNERDNLLKVRDVEGVSKIISYSKNSKIKYLLLKKEEGIDLLEYLEDNSCFSEDEIKKIAKSLLSSLKKIHEKKIIHYDIKPENIIYNKNTGKCTLIDFEQKYTKEYRSPEYINKKGVSTKTDIWSLGITLYYLVSDKLPFLDREEILSKKLTFPHYFSLKFKNFLGMLLEREPLLRYSAEDALEDEWLN